MGAEADIFLGFDPGGRRKFGVALLQGENASASTCSGVGEAVSWALNECRKTKPVAAGIDTLLHWSTDNGGMRNADRWLRDTYPKARSSVMCPNSLYGAMPVGGMGLALELRRHLPNIRLNETHPKLLFYAISGKRYRPADLAGAVEWFANYSSLTIIGDISNDDQFDALLSAWATREGYADGWQDLVSPDVNDQIFPVGEVNYLWPRTRSTT
jgi:hypothetical protein